MFLCCLTIDETEPALGEVQPPTRALCDDRMVDFGQLVIEQDANPPPCDAGLFASDDQLQIVKGVQSPLFGERLPVVRKGAH